MHMFYPAFRALNLAENATHNLHNIYPIRGAQARDANAWAKYLNQALDRFGRDADVAFAQHHWPVWGNARVSDFLGKQRDLYKYLHDQTARLMNHGYKAVEIAERLALPKRLASAWRARAGQPRRRPGHEPRPLLRLPGGAAQWREGGGSASRRQLGVLRPRPRLRGQPRELRAHLPGRPAERRRRRDGDARAGGAEPAGPARDDVRRCRRARPRAGRRRRRQGCRALRSARRLQPDVRGARAQAGISRRSSTAWIMTIRPS